MMTFVGVGGFDGGSVDGGHEDVSFDGCEAGSVGGCKDSGCGLNVCDGCCGGIGKVE